ncbi:hypothetical protein BaRGS_00002351 [Batillaria attramentaria]|uniref:Uncharacterized protein n=1 Tax=Batillaria attramentaria TaxID=370345 RepID=A0ABD0M2V7_9CAEN
MSDVGLTQSVLQGMLDRQEANLRQCIDSVRGDIGNLKQTLKILCQDVSGLKKRTDALERTTDTVCQTVSDHSTSISDMNKTLISIQESVDDRIEKLEEISRRDNLRFFGVSETDTYDACTTAMVVLTETFSTTFPEHLFPLHDVLLSPGVRLSDSPTARLSGVLYY